MVYVVPMGDFTRRSSVVVGRSLHGYRCLVGKVRALVRILEKALLGLEGTHVEDLCMHSTRKCTVCNSNQASIRAQRHLSKETPGKMGKSMH
jgi:hypothetical protein